MLITEKEILNPSIPDLPSKELVIELCKREGSRRNHLTYSSKDREIFIKYNNASMSEAHTQLFFYNYMMSKDNPVFRIPEIYHAFQTEGKGTYILKENIDIEGQASDEQRVQALCELVSVPPPSGVFGNIGGGLIRHPIFDDEEAPVHFASTAKLEAYINRALQWFNRINGRQDKVDFSNEPLMCYYADFHRSNFPVDVNGQLWVIDFEHAGVLPSSFMSYALRAHPRGLSHTLRKEIPVPVSNNVVAMGNASYIFKCVHNDFHISPERTPDHQPGQ
ncbi:hypothetical protein DTO207G8_1701 [Paecilomyces variotii]|nr:hypothetical protein DTO207G8_1701 [Paecilomyces variotii]